MTTIEHASQLAEMAAGILLEGPVPMGTVIDKDSLVREVYQCTLKKLVLEDSDHLEESELWVCINNSLKQETPWHQEITVHDS